MPTLAQNIKDIAEDEFTIPTAEVESLVSRFGTQVRGMGYWNTDGSLTLSREMVAEALNGLSKQDLNPGQALTAIFGTSVAGTIIDRLSKAKEQRLRGFMTEYQNTKDLARMEELERLIDREIFPQ